MQKHIFIDCKDTIIVYIRAKKRVVRQVAKLLSWGSWMIVRETARCFELSHRSIPYSSGSSATMGRFSSSMRMYDLDLRLKVLR